MIKRWDRFNESRDESDENRYQLYKDTYIKLVRNNIPQVENIIADVKDCFASFEDDGLIEKYQFGGLYNPDKSKSTDDHFSTSIYRRSFYPEADEETIKGISEFLMPKYWGEYINRFVIVGIDFPFEDSAWIGSEGIDLMDSLVEAKNRLKSMGYSMEMKFWKMWNPEPKRHGYSPLEVKVYFDLDCEWPEIYPDDSEGHVSYGEAGPDPSLRVI